MGAQLSFPAQKLPHERTFVITGGNTGIGYETSKAIARMGGRVIIACRSEERALQAIERMQKEHQENLNKTKEKLTTEEGKVEEQGTEELAQLQVEFMALDLSSFQSTMEFISAYKQKGYPLNVLICNAGIANAKQAYTVDGYESQFQINYLSHFLIILHLLPIMRNSLPDVRIVLVSSLGHKFGTWDMTNVQGKIPGSYGRLAFYGRSKLYQVMQMYALQRHLEGSGIAITSLHPGQVKTEIERNFQDSYFWSTYHKVVHGMGILRNPVDGAATSINCAVNPELAGVGGVYFSDCKPDTPSAQAQDVKAQEELWNYSLKCLKDHLSEEIKQEFPIEDTKVDTVVD